MKKHLLFLLCSLLAAFSIHAQQSVGYQDHWWRPNGPVYAIVRSGNTVYLGGQFDYIGPDVPYGTALSTSTGVPNQNFPKPNEVVRACIPDGAGGWYIAGDFTKVGSLTRKYVARINANGTLHPWNPNPNGSIYALAVSGNVIYIAGSFSSIGGQYRKGIAALDATTGNATPWNPNVASGTVFALAVNGSTVYAGGDFSYIGGQSRNYIAALDATTGNATAWSPNVNDRVFTVAVSGSTVYAAGDFDSVSGQYREYVAALDATTGNATAWNANVGGISVSALAISGSTVYVGGSFNYMGGQYRKGIAALDATTGNATAWNPNMNVTGSIRTLAVSGSTVYAGGNFDSIGGQSRINIAALDATTSNATAWNPGSSDPVWALAVSGNGVYVGGSFRSIGGQSRNNIAALNATTGSVTGWNPSADNSIMTLAVSGNTVYAGGNFTSIGGQSRNYIAAVDSTTGNATAWNPSPNRSVSDIAVSGSTVYVAGDFYSIGGQSRSNIAALDTTTGNATAWNPNPSSFVRTLAVSGSTVYAGGSFSHIGGQSRSYIAALDATTGNATAWNPNANNSIMTLAVSGNTVYAGGYFTSIGGQSRNNIAALNATTGNATAWNPNPTHNNSNASGVRTLAVNGSTVYVGGYFTSIGGQSRNNIAALNATTGNATAWNPNASSNIYALAISGNTVYVGGYFGVMGGNSARRNFAALYDSTWTNTPSPSVTITASANPVCSGTPVTFTATPTNANSPTYQWTRNGTVISGATATTYTINTLTNGDTIRCLMNSGGTTVSSNAVRMTINALPSTTLSASGPTTFCTGNSVTLTAPAGAAAYQWRKDNALISGATNASYTATVSGNYTVTATSATGCNATSAATSVMANTCVPTITALSAGTALCREQSFSVSFSTPGTFNPGNTFSVQLSSASGSFSAPTTIGTLTATGAATLTATIPTAQATGTKYRVRIVSSSPATTSADNGANITISGLPSAAQVLISPTTTPKICEGDSLLLSVPAVAGYSYQWLENNGLINGATANTYTASPAATKVYNCIVTNASGCARTSTSRQVVVNALPTAVITPSTTQNICGPNTAVNFAVNTGTGRTYQWYKNGTAISGATASTYTATTTGTYAVQSSTSSGCSALSASVEVTANCSVNITTTGTQTHCAGSTVTAAFLASGFASSNIFSLELSDENGAFGTPTTIGTLAAIGGTLISGNIPVNTPAGNGYKLRIRTSNPATTGPASPLTLQVRTPLTNSEDLCHVTVDNPSGRTRLIWNKPATLNIDSFSFYRQTNTATYARVGAQAYADFSEWTDTSSRPLTRAYRYYLTAQNACGEAPAGTPHKTVHLTINKGVNNATWNLIWNDYQGTTHSYYNIYRGTSPTNLSLIGTAIADDYNSFTDNNAPASCYYLLEVADNPSCNPMRGAGNGGSSIFSNLATNNPAGNIFAPSWVDMAVYPNPSTAAGKLRVESSEATAVFIIQVTDITGRLLQRLQTVAGEEAVFGEHLAPGLYTIEARSESGKRVVKKWTRH